jgi:hypothetical protein
VVNPLATSRTVINIPMIHGQILVRLPHFYEGLTDALRCADEKYGEGPTRGSESLETTVRSLVSSSWRVASTSPVHRINTLWDDTDDDSPITRVAMRPPIGRVFFLLALRTSRPPVSLRYHQ